MVVIWYSYYWPCRCTKNANAHRSYILRHSAAYSNMPQTCDHAEKTRSWTSCRDVFYNFDTRQWPQWHCVTYALVWQRV